MDNRAVSGRVASERFIGREEELEALGEDSGAVVIAGDAGVGKSRLIAELERRAIADGKFVLVGECVELTDGELPYAAVGERASADHDSALGLGITAPRARGARAAHPGAANSEIASSLVIAEKTASVHVSHILAKLDARNCGEAAAIAHRLGLTA